MKKRMFVVGHPHQQSWVEGYAAGLEVAADEEIEYEVVLHEDVHPHKVYIMDENPFPREGGESLHAS